jgi:drug/metabolite transporter (DMT)-like permease
VAAAVFLGVTLRPPQYAGGALTIIAVLLLAPADQERVSLVASGG